MIARCGEDENVYLMAGKQTRVGDDKVDWVVLNVMWEIDDVQLPYVIREVPSHITREGMNSTEG